VGPVGGGDIPGLPIDLESGAACHGGVKPARYQAAVAAIHSAAVLFALPAPAQPPRSGTDRPPEGRPTAPQDPRDFKGLAPAAQGGTRPATAGPEVALVRGSAVSLEEMRPLLMEAAGGLVLQELVLDRMLEERARRAGLAISDEDFQAERRSVVEAITRSAITDEAEAERLLESVRRSRGLGEERFARQLRRNALLRRLIPPVQVGEEEARRAFDIRYGPRYRARVITAATDRQASALRERLAPFFPPTPAQDSGEAPADLQERALRFGAAALEHSNDPSAERGGVLEPISPADPAWPASVCAQLPRMRPGELSPVLAVDNGFAILLLEAIIPAQEMTYQAAAETLRLEVRQRLERLAMDDLARRLLAEADVRVIDPALAWSWRSAK
jgi:parvulin-like peptidyl-prolyl isomerase